MLPVPVGKTVCRSTGSLKSVFERFETFVALSEKLYGVNLPRPRLDSLSDLNKFCQGLVLKDVRHPWRSPISGLGAQSRFGLAHSLFLFRKVIPKEKPHVRSYVEKLAVAQDDPDPEFVDFAIGLTKKLFRKGWDRTYQDMCLTSSLPLSACAENARRFGGCRGLVLQEKDARAEFCEYVLKAVAPRNRGVSRVKAIETGGKWRTISIPPVVDNALRPLHKAIYSHLSKFDWLLRGDAKPSRFKDFVPVEGEVFVSGDYESATDNLNSKLQLAVFRTLLDRAYTVPTGIREHAISIYSSLLESPDGQVFVQRRGQLMGQLTSFPLLCLINYITFRYSTREVSTKIPVRINGDDIVFRATPAVATQWGLDVAKGGLTLSIGKTLVHSRGFTLNSTPFWAARTGARLVGFVRSSALFPKESLSEQICSLNGRFYSACSGYGNSRRRVVRETFLVENQKPIHASRRSVTRGLGLAVGEESLKTVGLWYRELFYLEQVEERLLPMVGAKDSPIPPGWAQVGCSWFSSEEIDRWKQAWADECTWYAWQYIPKDFELTEDYRMDRIREGCLPYGLGTLMSTRVRRMLKVFVNPRARSDPSFPDRRLRVMSRSEAWRHVNLRRNDAVFGRCRRDRGSRMWVSVDLLASRTQVDFVRAAMS